ncbi:MAG: chitobiase/beta-hexosaminidase C-terminal domain-containing protein [Bacteroides sp.]|nr:chitobiase/beta-hexosaminidase C-terminal domain-containing protein [Bacteroides sp.]
MLIFITSVFVDAVASDVYKKITEASQLAANDQIILVYQSDDGVGCKAMGQSSENGKYRVPVDVVIVDNKIVDPSADVQIVTLSESSSGEYPWILKVGDGYLYLPRVANELWTTDTPPTSGNHDGYYVKITYSDGIARIVNELVSPVASTPDIRLQYNEPNEKFTYQWSDQKPVSIFKLSSGDDPNPDPDPDPDPAEPQDPELQFSASEVIFALDGDEPFVAPTLSNPHNVRIMYQSSNPNVASVVTNNGSITIMTVGTTTITATSVATDEYKVGTASYTLTVTQTPEPPLPSDNEADFNFSEMGYGNTEVVSVCEKDNIRLEFSKGDGSTPPTYYNSGSAIRLYAKNKLSLTVSGGYYISEIKFNTNSALLEGYTFTSNGTAAGSVEVSSDSKSYVWSAGTTQSATILLTQGGTSGNTQIKSINVKYATAPGATVAAPVITMTDTNDVYMVVMSCETPDAIIRYTMNGTDPVSSSSSLLYTEPIEVMAQTTFKAFAMKGSDISQVTTFTAVPKLVYTSFQPLYELNLQSGESRPVVVKGDLAVIYHNGQNLYARAADSYMLLYDKDKFDNKTFANGDKFNRVEGVFTLFNSQPEIENATVGETTPGEAIYPQMVDNISTIGSEMTNRYVSLCSVTVSDVNGKDALAKDGDGYTIAIYNKFLNTDQISEGVCNITGFIGRYNTSLQLIPVQVSAVTPPAVDPRVTIGTAVAAITAPIELMDGETAIVTFAPTNGVEVWYRIIEGTASGEFVKYTSPVEIATACTFEYYTVDKGIKSSTSSIIFTLGTTAITALQAENAAATFYINLSGQRVSHLTPGVYVRVTQGKAEKVIIK